MLDEPVSADQEITALAQALAAQGRHPMLVFNHVGDLGVQVVTNVFASI